VKSLLCLFIAFLNKMYEKTMKYFDFDESFNIGEPIIDSHHRRLFEIFDNLLDSLGKGKGKWIIKEILEELSDYSEYHFSEEEKFMKSLNYPYLENHIKQHNEFRKEVKSLLKRYDSKDFMVTSETADFLFAWIKHHIIRSDRKIADFIKKIR